MIQNPSLGAEYYYFSRLNPFHPPEQLVEAKKLLSKGRSCVALRRMSCEFRLEFDVNSAIISIVTHCTKVKNDIWVSKGNFVEIFGKFSLTKHNVNAELCKRRDRQSYDISNADEDDGFS